MSKIAPDFCLFCGKEIPPWRRGHGHPPKTCSEECRKKRASELERTRYKKVKNTLQWKETRAEYYSKLRKKLSKDPEFAAIFRARAAANVRNSVRKREGTDPNYRAQQLQYKREHYIEWRKALESDPEAWAAYKTKCVKWYHSLSRKDRYRIFRGPPKRKRKSSQLSVGIQGSTGNAQ